MSTNNKETPLSDVKVQPIDESIADPNRHRHEKSAVVQMGETLAEGHLPPNRVIANEIDDASAYLKQRENANPNASEAKLIKDVRELVQTAKDTIQEKNRDDLAQRFVEDVARLAEKAKNADTVNSPTEVVTQSNKFIGAAKNLIVAAAKSPNFRKALLDLTTVIRDVFQRVDTTQLENTFVDPNSSTKDIANAAKDTAQDFQNTNQARGTPESKRDVRADVKNLLQELNRYPESTTAFRALLTLWDMLTAEFYNTMDLAIKDEEVARVFQEAKQIIEAYAGDKSLDLLLLRLRVVVGTIELDKELSAWIRECETYLQKALDQPELIEQDRYYDEGARLFDQGKLFADKYKNSEEFNAAIDEAIAFANAMSTDEQMQKLGQKAAVIGKDLTYTAADGRVHVDPDFVSMIRTEVIPFFTNRIKEIPVPGFQLTSDEFQHLIVDDIFVTIDDVLPDRVKISSAESAEFKMNEADPLKTRAYVDIKVDGVKIKVKDFYFNFKRKMAVGSVSDEGRADLRVTGDGLHVHIRYELSIDAKRGTPALQNAKVDVSLANVALDITEAKHKTLLNMATTLFKGRIQKSVEDTLKIKIEEAGQDLAELLNKRVINTISPAGITGFIKTNLVTGV